MGLRKPVPRPGTIHYFERPPEQPPTPPTWRHRLHNVLIDAMMLVGGAAAVYGLLIHPLMRHLH
jgi:hypothetical protein